MIDNLISRVEYVFKGKSFNVQKFANVTETENDWIVTITQEASNLINGFNTLFKLAQSIFPVNLNQFINNYFKTNKNFYGK